MLLSLQVAEDVRGRNPEGGVIFQDAAVRPAAMGCDWHLYLGANPVRPGLHVFLVRTPEEQEAWQRQQALLR